MKSHTKLGLTTLIVLALLIAISTAFSKTSKVYKFDFSEVASSTLEIAVPSSPLEKIIKKDLEGKEGSYAVVIESLGDDEKYQYHETEPFPAASLYKLILLAAVEKEIEAGEISLDDSVSSTKTHLAGVLGEVDFGYEEAPERIGYAVREAMERVGRISDNFAAIMLTEKLRAVRTSRVDDNKLLIKMADDLGMKNTSFDSDPISTTAKDIAVYFKGLYNGQVVSKTGSEQIIRYLSLSNLNDRIPANLPQEMKIIHKTGELSKVRHDAGIVYLEGHPYLIVLLSRDLQYEDDAVETFAQISDDVYQYFKGKRQ